MIFSKEQILILMKSLQVEVITEERGYIFAKRVEGWPENKEIGPIQAKLSIMLEMADKE